MENENNFWADTVADHLLKQKRKKYVCEGMWTPSGYFHIGNSRPEIFVPNAIKRALEDKGANAQQNFIIDDFDALDKIPGGLGLDQKEWEKYIGFALVHAPAPFGDTDSWAAAFSEKVRETLPEFKVDINIISSYENYKSGKFNDLIKESLDKSKDIVRVWNRVAGSEKPDTFLPIQVVCESCGKIKYAEATGWDGEKVSYHCTECGHDGAVSPYDGKAKLHWRVHWAANWILHNVAVESAGKDHFSKGGSVDVGQAFMKEVFKVQPPYQPPTEFLNLKGKKQSGSVGNVIGLHNWLEVADPDLYRYLIFSTRPEKAIEFSFEDNSFILLNERFEQAERIYYGVETAQNERLGKKIKQGYLLSQRHNLKKEMPLQIPFSHSVLISQLVDPEKNLDMALAMLAETSHLKKSVSSEEKAQIKRMLVRTKKWVDTYAEDRYKTRFLETVEDDVKKALSPEIRKAFAEIAEKIRTIADAEAIQSEIFLIAKSNEIKMKELFSGLYSVLIGKSFGPKVGTLILALGKERCIARLKDCS